ncbi:hypothetical protein [Altericroceibacterium xinjiangense]|nr:hypothetical protein [Altericroceibacterium xinjiangense]
MGDALQTATIDFISVRHPVADVDAALRQQVFHASQVIGTAPAT